MALPNGLPQISDVGALLSTLGNDLVDIPLMTPTAASGTPAAGTFHSTVVNRAPMLDLSKDLGVNMGINRITTQQIYQLQDEFGPNGEPVWGVVNDKYGQIRFVGAGAQFVSADGQFVQVTSLNDYLEITFYGTGLNALHYAIVNPSNDYRWSVDGGAETSYATIQSSGVIQGRGYNSNSLYNIVSGLSLGVHTVKIRKNAVGGMNLNLYAFEILNESSSLRVNPGTTWKSGKKLYNPLQNVSAFNSGFESGTLGTRGGRVAVYQKADGSIGKAVNPTNASQLNLTSADHSNEEIARTYHWREFGAGRTDDFSLLTTTPGARAFTLDDGTTTLVHSNAAVSGVNAEFLNNGPSNGNFLILTFVGTGLDIVRKDTANGGSDTLTLNIDGGSNITMPSTGDTTLRTTKIVSGLPYGTHTVKFTRTTAVTWTLDLKQFIVYQPKTPTIPTDASLIGAYNIMANYDGTTATGTTEVLNTQIPVGVMYKNVSREAVYVGANWALNTFTFAPNAPLSTWTSAASAQYVEYTFVGTGVSLHFLSSSAGNYTATVDLVGEATPTVTPRANCTGGSGTLTTTTGVTPSLPIRAEVTGLSFGKHTIRVTKSSGAGNMSVTAFNVITPIHSYKNNGPFVLQNTLAVGSQGVGDSRTLASEVNQKNVSRAEGVTSTPSITTTTLLPLQEMSATHHSKTGKIKINFYGTFRQQGAILAMETRFAIFVNGTKTNSLGSGRDVIINSIGANGAVGASIDKTLIVGVGTHKIDVMISVSSSSVNPEETIRHITVEDVE